MEGKMIKDVSVQKKVSARLMQCLAPRNKKQNIEHTTVFVSIEDNNKRITTFTVLVINIQYFQYQWLYTSK